MKSVYERAELKITEFNTDDVIATDIVATSGTSEQPAEMLSIKENAYGSYSSFRQKLPWQWF